MLDIEEALTLDERSRVDFALGLRQRWADRVYPALAAQTRRAAPEPVDLAGATAALHGQDLYPWFSHLERAQQKMMWRAAGDAVLARRAALVRDLDAAAGTGPGELRLDPELTLPDWYTGVDIHVQPGGVWGADESAQVYELGARIVMLRDNDGYRFHELFTRTALPDLPDDAPRVVDVGCGFGKSTRPLVGRYPGAEVIGVDLAAPNLRLAHAEAAAAGLDIRFRQADARATGLPSGSVDLFTGTMVLHEMPAGAIRDTLVEAARVLRPGGALRFLEFWHTGDLVRDATVYEHAERNNEPYLRDLLDADVLGWCAELGLTGAAWLPFDERAGGVRTAGAGWPVRAEWHFPWAVLTATKERR